MFRFASPYFLILLAVIPLTVWYRRRQTPAALASSGIAAAVSLKATFALAFNRIMPAFYYAALVLMVAALARPQWGTQQIVMDTKGVNIILAVDLSESMSALDFQLHGKTVNRLEAVKSVVQDFVAQRSGDRIGMVVFGTQAYTQLPLTRDYTTITAMLDRLAIGAAGGRTAVGDAVGISLKRITDIESRSNVIILLTDGRSNSGELDPLAAADIAREKGVKIYTVGVGGQGRAPFLMNDPIFGQRYVYQRVDLDESTLKQIAERTGGLYFHAEDTDGLHKIYNTIDEMEKTEVKVKTFAQYDELYLYLLLPALAFLGIWIVLINTRFLKVP
jgi:Ca-activated chloride channel family protein